MNTTLTSSKKRLSKYDNLKGLAIIFIVFLHISAPFSHFHIRSEITLLIIPIFMSIFFFVSGYFTKIDENTQLKVFKQILIPFIIFTIVWIVYTIIVFRDSPPNLPYLVPTAGLWYLLALFWLRSFLSILIKIKHILLIAIILGLLIGLVNLPTYMGDFLSIRRTFAYMAIFLIGYYFKNPKKYYESLGSKLRPKLECFFVKISKILKENKKIVFIILICIFVSLLALYQNVPAIFLESKNSYVFFGYDGKIGMLMRLFVILSNIIVVILITYLIPTKKTFLTKLGRNSISIYILHFYFTALSTRILLKTDIGSIISADPYLAMIYSILLSTILLFILSRDFVEKYMRKIIKVVGNFLLKDKNKKIT